MAAALDRDHFPLPQRESRSPIAWRLLAAGAAIALATIAAAAPGAPAARAPDARRGEALYVGAEPLSAGGAPCLGCHGIAGHGLARAASFGPDLSGAHAQYGAEGLDGLLEDVVFPSMAPIYRDRAVTAAERADLVAFLAEAASARPASLGGSFAGAVAAAMAVFLGVVVVVGRRGRLRRDRAPEGAGSTP
jgi:mono/diheme cytochrome c family protein